MTPRIESIVSKFVADLTKAIQEEGAAAFAAAIGGGSEVGNGRRAPRPTAPKIAKRPKGAKREPEEIEALTKGFIAQVKATPGQNIEALAKKLGVTTKDLALPVQKAWDLKAIKSTGQRRGTKYFPK
jgi:hypothetical protein